jgi:hypothetical protein
VTSLGSPAARLATPRRPPCLQYPALPPHVARTDACPHLLSQPCYTHTPATLATPRPLTSSPPSLPLPCCAHDLTSTERGRPRTRARVPAAATGKDSSRAPAGTSPCTRRGRSALAASPPRGRCGTCRPLAPAPVPLGCRGSLRVRSRQRAWPQESARARAVASLRWVEGSGGTCGAVGVKRGAAGESTRSVVADAGGSGEPDVAGAGTSAGAAASVSASMPRAELRRMQFRQRRGRGPLGWKGASQNAEAPMSFPQVRHRIEEAAPLRSRESRAGAEVYSWKLFT